MPKQGRFNIAIACWECSEACTTTLAYTSLSSPHPLSFLQCQPCFCQASLSPLVALITRLGRDWADLECCYCFRSVDGSLIEFSLICLNNALESSQTKHQHSFPTVAGALQRLENFSGGGGGGEEWVAVLLGDAVH